MANFLVRALGVGTMTLTVAIGAAACSSASTSTPPKLQSNWIYTTNDGYDGTALDVKPDNTYVVARLALADSSNSMYSQIETGTLTVAGSSITFTPEQWTCQEPTNPAYSANYQITGDNLTVAFSWGTVLMKLNTATADSAPSGLVLVNGCFMKGGTFLKSPLTPVGSCGEGGGDCSAPAATCCNGYSCNNGGVCSAICTADTECKSACCPQASKPGNLRLCAPSTACK